MTVKEKLSRLREKMAERGISAYIIPTNDYHISEYVGEYFKNREYMSGFTGSAGTLVVLMDRAALWTDGRYFIQAEKELKNSTIDLMKSGEYGVPSINEYLDQNLNEADIVGYDARTITSDFADDLKCTLVGKSVQFMGDEDLVGLIWDDRPELSHENVIELPVSLTGMDRLEKISIVRSKIKESLADVLVISSLDDIAWLLNLRGNDVTYTPVFLSYVVMSTNYTRLYINPEILSEEIKASLKKDEIEVHEYDNFYDELELIPKEQAVWADKAYINEKISLLIQNHKKVLKPGPIEILKAVKTPTEQEGFIKAHIYDGVAVSRFIYWLKSTAGKEKITELSARDKFLEFRREMDGFIDLSFESIVAYGPHGAIVHYDPTPETDIEILPKSFCLTDTGGHYKWGSTDITRTIALGPLTDEEKRAFTLVLKGQLALADAVFHKGVNGSNLDYIAREPLWKNGYDYRHGTGHGVGMRLCVHEGPHTIHWRSRDGGRGTPFEPGMIVSDEPGVYIENKFGIRHENLVLVEKAFENEYGEFLRFKTLTMVPFDKEAIDLSLFTNEDTERLNRYHALVWDNISTFFDGEEKEWLRNATLPL